MSIIFASMLNVNCVAVDRYIALVYAPLRYEVVVTFKRQITVCAAIWIGPMFIMFVLFYITAFYFTLLIIAVIVLMVLIITVCLYFKIYHSISKSDHYLASMNISNAKKSRKLLKTCLTITILYCILWLPYLVISCLVFIPGLACYLGRSLVYMNFFSGSLVFINSLTNPLIYWYNLPDFRNSFYDICGRKERC
ncbi:uncharacterized protein [Antedon mediterranea]|uniref:uncharacterized protein n=1 Tax=Antedon mediterranea TaxID=105859 RepID=UPI003AF7714C